MKGLELLASLLNLAANTMYAAKEVSEAIARAKAAGREDLTPEEVAYFEGKRDEALRSLDAAIESAKN